MGIVSQFVTLDQRDAGPDPATLTITVANAGSLLVFGAAFYRHGVANTTDPVVTSSGDTVQKAVTQLFLFNGGLDSTGSGIWYVENASAGSHTFSFPLGGQTPLPTIEAFIAEIPTGLKSSSLDQTANATHNLADAAITDSLSFPLTTKGHTVRFSVFDMVNVGGGSASTGIGPPSGDTEMIVDNNSATSLVAEDSYQEFFADAARTITWNWTDTSLTGITDALVAANFGITPSGAAANLGTDFHPGRSPGIGSGFLASNWWPYSTASTPVTVITEGIGAFNWAGTQSSLTKILTEGVGAWNWLGTTSPVPRLVKATPATWTWAGKASPLSKSINALKGAYAWAGTVSPLSKSLAPAPAAYTWAGTHSTLVPPINASIGAWAWSGQPATFATFLQQTVGRWSWAGTHSSVSVPGATTSNYFPVPGRRTRR